MTISFTWIAHTIGRIAYLPIGMHDLSILLLENGVISVIVSAIVLRYFYVTAQWQRDVEASAEAQVQALQARIRPHFLFNSMNTIASLTRSDPATAEHAVEDLSELFRASLAHKTFVPLSEELELVGSYLRIEGQRLGERLEVEWDLDADAADVEIPELSLQPLVENAVNHGIEQCSAGGAFALRPARTPRRSRSRSPTHCPYPRGRRRANRLRGTMFASGWRLLTTIVQAWTHRTRTAIMG